MTSKAEMTIAIAGEFENGFADARKAAADDSLKWDGAKTSLNGAAKAVEALLAHVARDVKEGKFDIATGEAVRLYVQRSVEVCRNLRLKAEVQQERARGRSEALSMAENMAIRMKTKAENKLDASEDSLGADHGTQGDEGRPSSLSKLERLRSRRMTSDGKVVEGGEDPKLAAPQTPPKPAAKKKAKKKTRKKKTRKKA